MKKLIDKSIIAKPSNSPWKITYNANSKSLIKENHNHNSTSVTFPFNMKDTYQTMDTDKGYHTKQQNFMETKHGNSPQGRICNILKERNSSQQVSTLYSEHIYKSVQRNYIHEAELQKYRIMLENERKQKIKLLAEQIEWKAERAKLIEQKEVILFALDSMAVKMDTKDHYKKAKQIRRQTTQALKSLFDGNVDKISIKQLLKKQKMPKYKTEMQSRKVIEDLILESIENEGIDSQSNKIQTLRHIHEHLSTVSGKNMDAIVKKNEEMQEQLKQTEEKLRKAKSRINELESEITKLKQEKYAVVEKNSELNTKVVSLQDQNKTIAAKFITEQERNNQLTAKVKRLEEIKESIESDRIYLKARKEQLQRQLQITQQQYQSREEKQKQCVKILQKFTKQLKLSDSKIQQFLNSEELQSYKNQNSIDLATTKKAYHEHISYILHLCKKKQTVYEALVEDFKQKMKESDFRTSLLEKKLNNFMQYQYNLRALVQKQASKDALSNCILRFGY